eukprot:12154410-Alexandrium_andersonii.AAC.1
MPWLEPGIRHHLKGGLLSELLTDGLSLTGLCMTGAGSCGGLVLRRPRKGCSGSLLGWPSHSVELYAA